MAIDWNKIEDCLSIVGFDIRTAVLLAHCAELAYEPDVSIISRRIDKLGFVSVTVFDENNIQGYWVTSQDATVLVFRGTSNLGQWVRDARAAPLGNHPWGPVHIGFYEGILQLEDQMLEFDLVADRMNSVWMTGHSLGGALAVLAASRLRQRGIDVQVYTYGQPRIALGGFAEKFNTELPGRYFRFVNQRDIVPRLPPGLIYRHFGKVKRIVRPYVLESTGNLDQAPLELTESEYAALSEEEYLEILAILDEHPEAMTVEASTQEGMLNIIRDHAMRDYVKLLEEIMIAEEVN